MKAVNTEWIDVGKGIVTIVSSTEPGSLTITGADVEGLPDDCVIASGSVIVTPDKNYIAFEDGTFTEKSSSGGGSGGGSVAQEIYPFGARVTFKVSGLTSNEFLYYSDPSTPTFKYVDGYYELQEAGLELWNGEVECVILNRYDEEIYLGLEDGWTVTPEDEKSEFVEEDQELVIYGDTIVDVVYTG